MPIYHLSLYTSLREMPRETRRILRENFGVSLIEDIPDLSHPGKFYSGFTALDREIEPEDIEKELHPDVHLLNLKRQKSLETSVQKSLSLQPL